MKPNGAFKILNKKIYLRISYEDLAAIQHIVDIAPKEAQWFHRLERVEETATRTTYRIYEMYIPEQYCSGAEVESDPEMMVKFYRELVSDHGNENANDILSNLTVWCHSHHNMGVTPSGQDNKQFSEFVKNAKDSDVTLPQVMLIFNKKDMFYSRVWDPETGLLSENVPIIIDTPSFDWIDKQAKAKFKKKTVKPALSFNTTTGRPYNQGYLDWPASSHLSMQAATASKKAGRSKKKLRERESLQGVSKQSKSNRIKNRKALDFKDEITELAEACMFSNSCHTETQRLVTTLSQICDEKEFCIINLLLNGTDSEISDLKASYILYDEEDVPDAQIELTELLVDGVLPPNIISLAFEVAVALNSASSIEEATALIDFWLDAYASSFCGDMEITDLPV